MNTEILLKDRTTGKNILWANAEFVAKEITAAQIDLIKPRHEKVREHQKMRTRTRAEIFTPSWICELQNDLIDDSFKRRPWTDYVDANFLEITCGEAPYLVNLYDAATGEPVDIQNRVGLLDRKLRLIGKETSVPNDWINFARRAVQSIYGYEFQGDNLFLARKNVYLTVAEYYQEKFSRKPPEDFMLEVAEIISWNLWQMDGLTNSPPFMDNANLFGGANCLIKDWKTGEILEFKTLAGGARR